MRLSSYRRIFGAYELATEAQRHRDRERERRRDRETGRRGDGATGGIFRPVAPSLCLCDVYTAGMMTNRIDEGMMRSQINISTLGFRLRGNIMKRQTLLSMAAALFCLCAIRAYAQDDSKTIKSFYSKSDFALTADPNSGEWKKFKGVVATNGPQG